jgi:hypothetical protein
MCHGQKCNVCCRVLQLVELLQHDGVRRMRDSSRNATTVSRSIVKAMSVAE